MENNINLAVLYTHLLEIAFGIFMYVILKRLFNPQQGKYQLLWSYTWIIYGLTALALCFSIYLTFTGNATSETRNIFSFLTSTGMISEGLFFIYAARVIDKKNSFNVKAILFILAISSLISLMLVIPFSFFNLESSHRVLVKLGIRSCIMILAYGSTYYILLRTKNAFSGIGKKATTISFFILTITYVAYLTLRILSNYQELISIYEKGYFIILTDFIVHVFLGISMVIWMLEDEKKELSVTNEQINQFLYSTSHDLRAPIASILGLINLIELEKSKEMTEKYLLLTKDRIVHLDNVISDIINYRKSSLIKPSSEEVNLKELVNEVAGYLRYMENAKDIELVTDFEKDKIQGDPQILKTLISNIISNSVKYADLNKENPLINIKYEILPSKYRLTFFDNGIGIPKESTEKVFDMFYRAGGKGVGTGLGLHIVKNYIIKLNGEIKLESKKGEFTKLEITLPR